jgi:signal peptidase I
MRHRRARPDDEEESDDEDSDDEDLEEESAPRARTPRGRPPRDGVRPWNADKLDEEGIEEVATTREWFGRPKRPVYWRARDSLWFEPLVALAIVVLLIVGLWTYTQNWPPMYVVESDSMQHGPDDHVGLLNTGDLVLAQKVDTASVTTYMEGLQSGTATYGEFGDVILYHPNGDASVTPIIHRAVVYLVHNPDATWSIPELAGLSCSIAAHPYYSISTTPTQCGTNHVLGTLTLYNIGWQSVTVSLPLASFGNRSGFVTMGDNNYVPGNPGQGRPDQTGGVSALVQDGWVLGVARGMVPWFGALKLLVEGQASMVPGQSWQWMGLAIAGLVLIALGIHLALRSRSRDPGDGEEDEEGAPSLGTRLRDWFSAHREEDPADEEEARRSKGRARHVTALRTKDLLRRAHGKGGRPRPAVRRAGAKHPHPRSPSDRTL